MNKVMAGSVNIGESLGAIIKVPPLTGSLKNTNPQRIKSFGKNCLNVGILKDSTTLLTRVQQERKGRESL